MKTFLDILLQICMPILWHNYIIGDGWVKMFHMFEGGYENILHI